MTPNYEEMTYGELQAAAKEQGLNAKGSKEELLARLRGEVEGDAPEAEPETEEVEAEPEIVPEPSAPEAITEKKVAEELKTDIQRMKEHLAKQRKVSIMIPLEQGMSLETAEKVPFVVSINGYRLSIRRGVFVEVPEQVADMIKARLQSEGTIGSQFEIGNSPQKVEALG